MSDRIVELTRKPVEVAPGVFKKPAECDGLDLKTAAQLKEMDAVLLRHLAELK